MYRSPCGLGDKRPFSIVERAYFTRKRQEYGRCTTKLKSGIHRFRRTFRECPELLQNPLRSSLPPCLSPSLFTYIYMNVYVCISFSEMFFLEEKHSISISRSRGQLSLFSNMQQIQVIVKQRVLTKNIEVNRLLRCILSRRKCGTRRNRVSE